MKCYFFAQIRITDEAHYQKYLDRVDKVSAAYKGELLAVDDAPEILEGSWNYTRAVLIRFPSRKDFRQWYNSTEYQEILKYRLEAADCDTIVIEGKE